MPVTDLASQSHESNEERQALKETAFSGLRSTALEDTFSASLSLTADSLIESVKQARLYLETARTQGHPLFKQEGARIEIAHSPNRRLLVLGDLHGDHTSLCKALSQSRFIERVAAGEDITLVGLGDYINKGPQSLEVLHLLCSLISHPLTAGRVLLLRGNHENGKLPGSKTSPLRSKLIREIAKHRAFMDSPHEQTSAKATDNIRIRQLRREAWNECKALFNELPLVVTSNRGLILAHSGFSKSLARERRRKGEELLRSWPPPEKLTADLLGADIIKGRRLEHEKGTDRVTGCPASALAAMLRKYGFSLLVRGHQHHPHAGLDSSNEWKLGSWWITSGRGSKAVSVLTLNSTTTAAKSAAAFAEIDLSKKNARASSCTIARLV